MKSSLIPLGLAITLFSTGCAQIAGTMTKEIAGGLIRSALDRESSREKAVRTDSSRLARGEDLKHFSSERRLQVAKDDLAIDDLRGSADSTPPNSEVDEAVREWYGQRHLYWEP